MKIALVHDYLTQKGGAERVFELLCENFPQADIYTSLYNAQTSVDLGPNRTVHTTYLQKIPGGSTFFRLLAPFYFSAFQKLDLQSYDLIISSTTGFAKAVKQRPDATHICLCHNITRFLWNTQDYLRQYPRYRRIYPFIRPILSQMKRTDFAYAQNPDFYIANSTVVADRIEKIYDRPAVSINFPIESENFEFSDQKDDYYLVSSRLIGYKRVDVVVEAFNWLGLPLLIIGNGPERERLEAKALDNVVFLGHVSDAERSHLMAKAQAVIVVALEDYGLVPIEANASGTPVIAYGRGGVLDTQVPGVTGLFVDRQTPEAIQSAVTKAQQIQWQYHTIRAHALSHFSAGVFFEQLEEAIESLTELKRQIVSEKSSTSTEKKALAEKATLPTKAPTRTKTIGHKTVRNQHTP